LVFWCNDDKRDLAPGEGLLIGDIAILGDQSLKAVFFRKGEQFAVSNVSPSEIDSVTDFMTDK